MDRTALMGELMEALHKVKEYEEKSDSSWSSWSSGLMVLDTKARILQAIATLVVSRDRK